MALLRHGGLKKLFTGTYAPSTLGSFRRRFTFGHVRQLDAITWRWLVNVAAVAPIVTGIDDFALVDIDDTIKEVHGHHKQGSGNGYSGVRGLNALLGIVSTQFSAPIIVGSRLRRGATGSPRGGESIDHRTDGSSSQRCHRHDWRRYVDDDPIHQSDSR